MNNVDYKDNFLLVNDIDRTIEIPENEKLFGIVKDKDSERKYFLAPKIIGDNIDLTKSILRIVYHNANGESGQYLIEDIKDVYPNRVAFSWLISNHVTMYEGVVYFTLTVVKMEGGTENIVWNTSIAEGMVKDGLAVDNPVIPDPDNDIVAQLIAESKKNAVKAETEANRAEEEADRSKTEADRSKEQANISTQNAEKLLGKIKYRVEFKTVGDDNNIYKSFTDVTDETTPEYKLMSMLKSLNKERPTTVILVGLFSSIDLELISLTYDHKKSSYLYHFQGLKQDREVKKILNIELKGNDMEMISHDDKNIFVEHEAGGPITRGGSSHWDEYKNAFILGDNYSYGDYFAEFVVGANGQNMFEVLDKGLYLGPTNAEIRVGNIDNITTYNDAPGVILPSVLLDLDDKTKFDEDPITSDIIEFTSHDVKLCKNIFKFIHNSKKHTLYIKYKKTIYMGCLNYTDNSMDDYYIYITMNNKILQGYIKTSYIYLCMFNSIDNIIRLNRANDFDLISTTYNSRYGKRINKYKLKEGIDILPSPRVYHYRYCINDNILGRSIDDHSGSFYYYMRGDGWYELWTFKYTTGELIIEKGPYMNRIVLSDSPELMKFNIFDRVGEYSIPSGDPLFNELSDAVRDSILVYNYSKDFSYEISIDYIEDSNIDVRKLYFKCNGKKCKFELSPLKVTLYINDDTPPGPVVIDISSMQGEEEQWGNMLRTTYTLEGLEYDNIIANIDTVNIQNNSIVIIDGSKRINMTWFDDYRFYNSSIQDDLNSFSLSSKIIYTYSALIDTYYKQITVIIEYIYIEIPYIGFIHLSNDISGCYIDKPGVYTLDSSQTLIPEILDQSFRNMYSSNLSIVITDSSETKSIVIKVSNLSVTGFAPDADVNTLEAYATYKEKSITIQCEYDAATETFIKGSVTIA